MVYDKYVDYKFYSLTHNVTAHGIFLGGIGLVIMFRTVIIPSVMGTETMYSAILTLTTFSADSITSVSFFTSLSAMAATVVVVVVDDVVVIAV